MLLFRIVQFVYKIISVWDKIIANVSIEAELFNDQKFSYNIKSN